MWSPCSSARCAESRRGCSPRREFRFHLLPSEPIYRRTWWKNVRWPMIMGRLLRAVAGLFEAERPVAVLGTGGYASGPVVWWATRHGVPTAMQEQNAYPGLATRLLSRRVRHVYLGLPEARSLLRFGASTEVFDTGNPIAPPTPERRAGRARHFGLDGTRPVVLVTGGSQGALAINRAVAGWLDSGGPKGADLIWVTGRGTHEEFAPVSPAAGGPGHRFSGSHGRRLRGGRSGGVAGGHDHGGGAVCLGPAQRAGAASDCRRRSSDAQRAACSRRPARRRY